MESTTLEINVVSARDLHDVNLVSRMDVYAVVLLVGDNSRQIQKVQTNVDREGGRNPNWNFPMEFSINELAAMHNPAITLVFTLRAERAFGDRDIGEVHVPIAELLQSAAGDRNSMKHVSFAVRKASGKNHGVLNFQFKFGGNVVGSSTATTARGIGYTSEVYPPPAPAIYPPPPPYAGHGGHPYPPPQNYGYPHQQPPSIPSVYGNGYPPQQQPGYPYPYPSSSPSPPPPYVYNGHPSVVSNVTLPKGKKSHKKMLGVGAGLIGGMIGGLLLGDFGSDIGSGLSDIGSGASFDDSLSYTDLCDQSMQSMSDSMDMMGSIG